MLLHLTALALVYALLAQHSQLITLRRALRARSQKGTIKVKLANNHPDFGYEFDLSGVTDEEGEVITDPTKLAAIVKEVASDNPEVLTATDTDSTDTVASGTCHVGRSGTATLLGRAWKSQASKDAGDDPLIVASEEFIITQGDPAAVTEAKFNFSGVTES